MGILIENFIKRNHFHNLNIMVTLLGLNKVRKLDVCLITVLVCVSVLTACTRTNPESTEPAVISQVSEASEGISEDGSILDSTSRSTDNPSASVVRFGILTINSALSVHERYGPLLDYLSEKLDRPFELVAITQENQFNYVAEADLDFVASNPLASVQIQRLYKTELLTTLARPNTGAQFSGLIITNSDSEIETLDDLKDKTVACVNFQAAAGGCLFQIYHLLQNDIDPFQDFAQFIETPSQDNIVLSVLNHSIDAGFIRTGQLEKMIRDGLIKDTDNIRILDRKEADFSFAHTTALYPEWAIASLATTDPELAESVKTLLLDVPADHPALEAANLSGLVPSANYEPIHSLIETLKLKSWESQ